MYRALRFAVLLVAGLGLLTWIALLAANETTRRWFERDVTLRAELALSGSRRALVSHWRQREWPELRTLLVDITHDERIMAAAACTAELEFAARTPEYPQAFPCADLGRRVRPGPTAPVEEWRPWRSVEDLAGGKVHVSALPVGGDQGPLGFVVLLHDISFMER